MYEAARHRLQIPELRVALERAVSRAQGLSIPSLPDLADPAGQHAFRDSFMYGGPRALPCAVP
jgi:hypothetical protein